MDDCLKFGLLFSLHYEAQAKGDLDQMLTSRGLPEPERKGRPEED